MQQAQEHRRHLGRLAGMIVAAIALAALAIVRLPAPASISTGPSNASTAARCAGFRSSR